MNKQLLNKMHQMSEEELFAALYKDHLTGAYNRAAFEERDPSPVAIIDLDSLKYLNDEYGHRTGDKYLIDLVKALEVYFDAENIYRLSGDEFVIGGNSTADLIYRLQGVRQNFPCFTFGVGYDLVEADERLIESKARRESLGLRAPRGECPPWTVRAVA